MTSKVTVLLSEEEFVRLDAYCKDRGFKKSTLLARLVREHLNQEGFQAQANIFERPPEERTAPEKPANRRKA